MPGRHYVLAFSGGLDTSYALAVLVDRGERVTTVTVNTGGFPPDELRDIEQRSQELGADDHVVIDGRARLATSSSSPTSSRPTSTCATACTRHAWAWSACSRPRR